MQKLKGIRTQREGMRLVLDKILFATDFSLSSEVALRYALALASHYDSKLYVVHAVAVDSSAPIPGDAKRKALDAARQAGSHCARELRESGKLDGVRHEILVGEEDKLLLNLAGANDVDLTVNGVAHRDGQTVVLEPAVEELIRRSECPVLSVGSMFHSEYDGKLKNILFATDFSPESLEASRYALSLAQEFQARLTLLHVVEGAEPNSPDEKIRVSRPYKLWLGKLVPDEARQWCELDFAVEFGRPAERILQVAWENHADLIVVGARGFGRLTSPGVNVHKIMSNAWCPVLTITGALDIHKQKRFWRSAAWDSKNDEETIAAVS
jgi:nucleotide-binding universal stress UspA family protein